MVGGAGKPWLGQPTFQSSTTLDVWHDVGGSAQRKECHGVNARVIEVLMGVSRA